MGINQSYKCSFNNHYLNARNNHYLNAREIFFKYNEGGHSLNPCSCMYKAIVNWTKINVQIMGFVYCLNKGV